MLDPHKILVCWDINERSRKISKFMILPSNKDTGSSSRLPASAGSCDHDWMDGSFRSSPLGLYTYLVSNYGFQSRDLMVNALDQFSKVKSQDWAHELLSDLGARHSDDG